MNDDRKQRNSGLRCLDLTPPFCHTAECNIPSVNFTLGTLLTLLFNGFALVEDRVSRHARILRADSAKVRVVRGVP